MLSSGEAAGSTVKRRSRWSSTPLPRATASVAVLRAGGDIGRVGEKLEEGCCSGDGSAVGGAEATKGGWYGTRGWARDDRWLGTLGWAV